MSLPAQQDGTFQVMALAAGATVAAADPAALAAPLGAVLVVGAFCERHALRKAPRPESDPYFNRERRVSAERRLTSSPPPTQLRRRAHSIPRHSACQGRPSAWWYVR